MRKNITKVLQAFRNGESAHGETCSTDGTKLYSYALPIARRINHNTVQIRKRWNTRTTNAQIKACLAFFSNEGIYRDPQVHWHVELADEIQDDE